MEILPSTVKYFNEWLEECPELMQLPAIQDFIAKELDQHTIEEVKQHARIKARKEGLIKQLFHIFPELPNSVVTFIQETNDYEQLVDWTLEIVTANSWEEIFPDIEP